MIAVFPWLAVAVVVLAIISLIRKDWEPTLIPVAVLILGFIHLLGLVVH